jgi:hypothetical protein
MIGPVLIAGFSLGLISSLHCIGMCGPLVLALPLQGLSGAHRMISTGLYHGGRIGMYAGLGLLSGLLGHRIYIAGWQQGVSIGLGTAILLSLGWKWMRRLFSIRKILFPGKFYNMLRQWILRLWQSPSTGNFFLLGVANGLLPCGMVYFAVAGALSLSGISQGLLFMVSFGTGTLPLLLLLSYFGHQVRPNFRVSFQKGLPFLIAIMAVLLILRGLNLGIPYISPILPGERVGTIECH